MYITNRPDIALIAEQSGVDRIFIDMEYIGKAERQSGMDTVQSHHTVEDVRNVRSVLTKAELLVRCNALYDGSEQEIDEIIEAGADIVMLPYFHTADEVREFLRIVGGRVRTCLLLETPGAADEIDRILALDGIDEIHIGINDLSLGYGKKFLFEVLADGTVDYLSGKIREKGIPYGFGGIASLGRGLLSSEHVIMEHYRLGSTRAILSRSFCDTTKVRRQRAIKYIFDNGLKAIRDYEEYCVENSDLWEENREETAQIIRDIAAGG